MFPSCRVSQIARAVQRTMHQRAGVFPCGPHGKPMANTVRFMASKPLYTSNQMYNFDDCFAHRNIGYNSPHIASYVEENTRILDVGCSTGAITLSLAKHNPSGYVLGIDHEPGECIMLRLSAKPLANSVSGAISLAKQHAKEEGITNVEFRVANAEDMDDIQDESFDIAHAHQVLLHVTYPITVLKEMRRVVKTGGIVATRDNCHVFRHPEHPLLEQHVNKFIARSLARGAHPVGSHLNHEWVNEAGFPWECIEMGAGSWDWSSPENKRNWTSGVLAGGLGPIEGIDRAALEKEVEEWVKNPRTRIIALDSWVIGHKK
ncbi:hypothetical protein H9L39_19734 [Fusarium oxysporum f. sp. albedinis]|nr:hypothetical protein H9L39_19734 [Fusarium oxysporum f. sp. albedinis]